MPGAPALAHFSAACTTSVAPSAFTRMSCGKSAAATWAQWVGSAASRRAPALAIPVGDGDIGRRNDFTRGRLSAAKMHRPGAWRESPDPMFPLDTAPTVAVYAAVARLVLGRELLQRVTCKHVNRAIRALSHVADAAL